MDLDRLRVFMTVANTIQVLRRHLVVTRLAFDHVSSLIEFSMHSPFIGQDDPSHVVDLMIIKEVLSSYLGHDQFLEEIFVRILNSVR